MLTWETNRKLLSEAARTIFLSFIGLRHIPAEAIQQKTSSSLLAYPLRRRPPLESSCALRLIGYGSESTKDVESPHETRIEPESSQSKDGLLADRLSRMSCKIFFPLAGYMNRAIIIMFIHLFFGRRHLLRCCPHHCC